LTIGWEEGVVGRAGELKKEKKRRARGQERKERKHREIFSFGVIRVQGEGTKLGCKKRGEASLRRGKGRMHAEGKKKVRTCYSTLSVEGIAEDKKKRCLCLAIAEKEVWPLWWSKRQGRALPPSPLSAGSSKGSGSRGAR